MNNLNPPLSYKNWLLQKGYSPSTIHAYWTTQKKLSYWLEQRALNFDFQGILAFFGHCQKEGIKPSTLIQYHARIQRYSAYLIATQQIQQCPIQNWKISYNSYGLSPNTTFLSASQMDDLYQLYMGYQRAKAQHKILLGLTIYQAMHGQEIHHLKARHIWIDKGKILLPGYAQLNPRTLPLQATQIIQLHGLLQARKPNELLLQYSSQVAIHKARWHIKERLKNLCLKAKKAIPLQHLQQLRASRIALWVKSQDLRIAQHQAGHKRIHSTEKYVQQDLTALQNGVQKYHPLQNL